MILKHFKFSFYTWHTSLSSALRNTKTFVYDKPAWSVRSKITLRTSLVTTVRGFRHFPWIPVNLIQFLICSVYEYGPLQNKINVISKLLRKWSFISKIYFKMAFKACTFYFQTKWLFIWTIRTIPSLTLNRNTDVKEIRKILATRHNTGKQRFCVRLRLGF